MGVPTSEVDYMPRREDHEVHKDMWGHWGKKMYIYINVYIVIPHLTSDPANEFFG